MLRCSLGQDFWYPWLPGSGIQNEARSCGRKVTERFLQNSLLLLAFFLLVIPSGCSTVGKVGREFGTWGIQSLLHERFEALCHEVNLRPSVDVKLVIEDDLKGSWGYVEKKGDHYLMVLSLKKLQWQPEMIETILRHEMAHVLSTDMSHGERWVSACGRLGIAPNVAEPVKPLYASFAFSPFPNRRMR